jgi:hypothetical protein
MGTDPGSLKRAKMNIKKTRLKDRYRVIRKKSIKINVIGIKMLIVTLFSLKFNIIF